MLEEDIKIITNIPEKEMIFGIQEKQQDEKETRCWVCKEEFNDIKILRSETIAILLVGIEEPRTARVILSIENQILCLWCSITLVVMKATYL